jgi:hypothetical protein
MPRQLRLPKPLPSRRGRKVSGRARKRVTEAESDPARLFHHLNNQLAVILANAELLERRLAGDHRTRAELVVSGVVEAIQTVRTLRQALSAE